MSVERWLVTINASVLRWQHRNGVKMHKKPVWALVFGVLATSWVAANAQDFALERTDHRLDIRFDGKPVATYVFQDEHISRPYFSNVFAPNGEQVTRRHPTDPVVNKDNDDHDTYHPGIWLAFGDLSGEDYWRNVARVRHVRFLEAPRVDENSATFGVENVYESSTNPATAICRELCTYTIFAEANSYYLISQSTFSSKGEFAFGDQEEMGLGVRLATRFTVQHGSGTIRNSEGGTNERETWGRPADWCSYFGLNEGMRVGITIMPSPGNFRRSWFHTRDYGLMVANPFGTKAMTGANDDDVAPESTSVHAGDDFRLGFGVRIFSEPIDENNSGGAPYLRYEVLRERAERIEE